MGKGIMALTLTPFPPLSLPFSHSFSAALSWLKSRTPSIHLGDEEIHIPPAEPSPRFSLFPSTAPQRWTGLCISWLREAPAPFLGCPEGPDVLRSFPAAILALGFRLSVPVASDLPGITPGLLLRLSAVSADSQIHPLLQWPQLHVTIPDFASRPSPIAPSQTAVPNSAPARPGLSQPPPSALLCLLPGLLRTRLSPPALDGHPDSLARPRLYAPSSLPTPASPALLPPTPEHNGSISTFSDSPDGLSPVSCQIYSGIPQHRARSKNRAGRP